MKDTSFLPGSLLAGKYSVLRVLGEGGTATVYLVMDMHLHTTWALKRIYKTKVSAVLYQRETAVLKTLSHPGLPRMVDCFITEENYCIVMDYISGLSLEHIWDAGQLSIEHLINWSLQTAEILIYLHAQHPAVYCQDLKPEHLILKKNGTLVLLDAGMNETTIQPLYAATRKYAAPEQLRQGHVSEQTDLYNFGKTFLALLERAESVHALTDAPYAARYRKILQTCTAYDVNQRYRSAEILVKNLRRMCRHRKHLQKRALTAAVCITVITFITAAAGRILHTVSPAVEETISVPVTASAESEETESGPTPEEQLLLQQIRTLELLVEEDISKQNHSAAAEHLTDLLAAMESAGYAEQDCYRIRLRRVKQLLMYGSESEIRSSLEELIRSDPAQSEPYVLYISFLYACGDLETAGRVFERLSRLPNASDNPNYETLRMKLQHAGVLTNEENSRESR